MRQYEDTYRHKGLRTKLVAGLREKGITDERVLEAISNIPRHFFLDTNVVFDYLGRREPNGAAAAALFQAAYEGRATLHVASLSFSHVFYTLRKQFGA